MQNLSEIVGKRVSKSLKRTIILIVIVVVFLFAFIIVRNISNTTSSTVELYTSQLDTSMGEKLSFINTIAYGVSTGNFSGDQYYDYVDSMVSMFEDVSAVYACVPEDGVVYSDGIMTYMSGGWVPPEEFVVSDRGWFKGALEDKGTFISAPYVDEQTGSACITLAHIVDTPNGKGVVGLDMYMSDISTLVEKSYDGSNYIFTVCDDGTILTHPSEKYALTTEKSVNISETKYVKVFGQDYKKKLILDYSGGLKMIVSKTAEKSGWTVIYVFSLNPMIIFFTLFIIVAVLAVTFGTKFACSRVLKVINPMFTPLENVSQNISSITDGELEYHFDVDMQSMEVNNLTNALNQTIEGLKYYIDEISKVVGSVADKNLDFEVDGSFKGDYEKIKNSLEEILIVLNESFKEINEQSETVSGYAADLSATSTSVAEAATTQSHAIADANSEVNKMAESMRRISEIADAVAHNANETNARLTVGGQEMNELVKAMDNIIECFDGIAAFVSEINSIASQTNLLSLNASIEAARAGEAGRGFAVVAQEIQDLSNHSSEASKKIENVIKQSKEAVDHGRDLVERTQKTIEDGINYSVENTKNVNEISNAVNAQQYSVDEISARFTDISDMVENNAAIAEENSAIATQLGECAKSLSNTVAEFRLR